MASRSTEVVDSTLLKERGRASRAVKSKVTTEKKTAAGGKTRTVKTATVAKKTATVKTAPATKKKRSVANAKSTTRRAGGDTGTRLATPNGRARPSAGRPPRLSRKMILEKAMALLEQGPVEDFTMARVAASLDTVSMALYNYFPSRKALLAAVADHVCLRFKMPPRKRKQTWQDTLWQWLWSFKQLAETYPFILKVMGVDGQSSPGWLRVTLTVSRTLHDIGFREHKLAVHAWMFCSNAIGLVFNEREGSIFRSPISLSDIEELEPDEQDFLIMLRRYHSGIASEEVLELGFQGIIANVERELANLGVQ